MPQDRYQNLFEKYNDILTIPELAAYLRIGRNKAYELVNTRKIKGKRIGSEWRIARKNVIDYLER